MGSALRTIVALPARLVRGAWHFIDPPLKAGRIPLTRTVFVMLLAGAFVFVGYTLVKKDIQYPLKSDPYYVDVILPDAAGLDPGKEPLASVAGAAAGRVAGIREQNGRAIATLRLEPELRGKVFADATASLRPINVLQVLNVNVMPGDPQTGPLPEGRPIPADRTDSFVHIDELTSVLDADTQAQVRILIREAAAALRGREPELRKIFGELAELTETSTPITKALDRRRELLVQLTDNLDVLFTTLAERREQLVRTIDAGNETLEVTADRELELTEATRLLAPVLAKAESSLAGGRALADSLNPAVDQLLPVADELQPAADEVLELIPKASSFLDAGAALIREGRRPLELFELGTRGLGQRVLDLIPAVDAFGETIGALDKFKGGIAQTADLWTGAFSTQANTGPYSQVYFGNGEITPEGLGLLPEAAEVGAGGTSRMHRLLAMALEVTCARTNTAACALRFSLPGLPDRPLLSNRQLSGDGG